MRALTAILAILTLMIAAGMMTARGQALLGLRPPPSAPSVTVIKDPPPAPPVHQAVPSRPPATPASRPAPASAPPAHAAPATPAQTGIAQISRIANILLNLPQVLSQTQVHPAPDHRPPDEP